MKAGSLTYLLSLLLPAMAMLSCSEEPTPQPGGEGGGTEGGTHRPVVTIWNYDHMLAVREALRTGSGDEDYREAFDALISTANVILPKKAASVMDKPDDFIVQSGDKHDFVTIGKYSWPNPDTPDGLPWIQKDGERNPQYYPDCDAPRQNNMCERLRTLGLAYFFTGEEKYAAKAVEVASVWFLNPDTYMTPNMEFSQVIPGKNVIDGISHGNPPGIIEGYIFVQGLAGLALVQGSEAYTEDFDRGMKQWFADFADWLRTSRNGTSFTEENNITFARDEQLIVYDLFCGNTESAMRTLAAIPTERIQRQIRADGAMPKELKRTLAYSYSAFNLIHMLEVCELARETLPGLVNTRVGGSGSISDAVYFVASFLGRTAEDFAADGRVAEFGGRQISGWEAARGDVLWLCRRIGAFDTSPSWDALFSQYAAGNDKTAKDNINYLIY